MTQNQDKNILIGQLLAIMCGIAIVAANTNSFKPTSYSVGGSRGNVSGVSNQHKIKQPNILNRSKRVAIYDGQGTVKFVAGVAHPVKQADKDQSFWFFYNFQNQYTPTPIPIYYWSFWNTTTFVSTARQLRKGFQATLNRDDTRSWLYDSIEAGLEQLDGSKRGASCLLRSICEISQLPFENSNIFSEVLNAVLIPSMNNVAEKYLNARDAGRAGADCMRTYNDCTRKVWDWLTHVTKLTF